MHAKQRPPDLTKAKGSRVIRPGSTMSGTMGSWAELVSAAVAGVHGCCATNARPFKNKERWDLVRGRRDAS